MTTAGMRKSSLTKIQKKMRKSSSSSSSDNFPSFLSLPYDVVINSLARISRTNYPILSLVSKSFRSLLASPDLEAARSVIGKPEKYLHVCLNLNNNSNPKWFILSPTPNQRKLIPIPSFPYQHLKSSTVVSVGSETYIIGGVNGGKRRRSRKVFLIDCKSHQWRKLPEMRLSRKEAAVDVMDGKIYVIGGCSSRYYNTENYGEVYDPKTQTWEPTTLDLTNQHSAKTRILTRHGGICYKSMTCVVEPEKDSGLRATVSNGELFCGGLFRRLRVEGLEAISSNYLISVSNPGGGRRVTVWWKTYTKECSKTEIWCAEILIVFSPENTTTRGFVEWSENVFTFQGFGESDDSAEFLLHSALVAHDY